ncbi:Alcohol dehydrogenase superfamily zinc-containing [Metarhizium anisopliae]|nr:Alcohol dehydrogenase superfamily zinc-containing [Metarhizium anisopliae]
MAQQPEEQMRAARLVKYKSPYELQSISIPKPGPRDLLFKVGAAGYCHTDYQVWEGVYQSETPMTPSHEPVGTIVSVGPAVDNWQVGDRIGALLFRHACGKCQGCLKTKNEGGRTDLRFCTNVSMAGIKDDGALAEYMIADASNAVKLPDSVTFEQAAPLMCAGATVWGAIKAAELKPGAFVGVIGIGGLGSLAIQFLKALGHPTVAIDRRPEALELAAQVPLKPDLIVDSGSKSACKDITSWADNEGLAAVIVCTDDVPVNEWSLKLLRIHGRCVVVGVPTAPFQFSAFDLIFKELSVVGSLVATVEEAREMMDIVERFGVRSHVHVLSMDEAPELPSMYMNPHLKGRLVVRM